MQMHISPAVNFAAVGAHGDLLPFISLTHPVDVAETKRSSLAFCERVMFETCFEDYAEQYGSHNSKVVVFVTSWH